MKSVDNLFTLEKTMIQVRNLNYTYPKGKVRAANDLNFSINKGEIFGFLGPSGAGKSTTQKLLIGLLKGYQGSAEIMGQEVSAWGQDYYNKIGVGFELPNHYLKLTARENLAYFQSLYEDKSQNPQTLMESVGLGDAVDTRVGAFSKGMKVRLNFVRALLHNPQILFLDEPTTGLDPMNARRVKGIILAQKNAGKTIFLTTHNMNSADELCDRVAFITDGAIRACDTPKSLKLAHGKRRLRIEYQGSEYPTDGQLKQAEFPLDGLAENSDFQAILRQHPIQTMHSQETTLDQVFIEVTGRELTWLA